MAGVAALLIERTPSLDPAAVHEILTLSAKDLGAKGRDDAFGWGLVDPARALQVLEAKITDDAKGNSGKPGARKAGTVSSR